MATEDEKAPTEIEAVMDDVKMGYQGKEMDTCWEPKWGSVDEEREDSITYVERQLRHCE
jgi:hypothetical protein